MSSENRRIARHTLDSDVPPLNTRCRPNGASGQWQDRNDVSDFVWCLEEAVTANIHEQQFDDIPTPTAVREWAIEPNDHDDEDIRGTWIQNIGT